MAAIQAVPTLRERQKVDDTLKTVKEQEFDEVVILGFKDGKSFLHHSMIADSIRVVGALESIKYRLLEK